MIVYAWTPCSDGTIKKIDATSIVTTVTTGCSETWIAVANKLALVPGRRGEVVSMNGLGTIKDQRTLQHRIAIAVGVVNDVYCFDGRGKGTIVTLDNNGLITVGEKFTCSGVVDPMNAILDGTAIYIACRNEDVYSFETTTQVTTRISRNRDDVLTSVVDNNTITKLHNNAIYARLFGGAVIGGIDYFIGNGAIHTNTNRIVDSRIRSDGICIPVGSDGTQFVKSCPSRESMQWITGNVVASEITGISGAGSVVFAPSNGTSNETPLTDYGAGVYSPDDPLDSIPAPTYSSVTVSISGSPIVPPALSFEGRGAELDGVHTLPILSDSGTYLQAVKIIDPIPSIEFTIILLAGTPFDITANVGLGQTCGGTAPYTYYMRYQAVVAAYSWGGLTAHVATEYPTNYPVGALAQEITFKSWPPYTCPQPNPSVTILSWNR